jgi:hypothetical protein
MVNNFQLSQPVKPKRDIFAEKLQIEDVFEKFSQEIVENAIKEEI